MFEAPDEQLHFLFVRHLAEGRGLPVQQPSISGSYAGQESSQPPLYYALGALLIAGRDLGALREDVRDVFAAPGTDLSARAGGPRERGRAAMFAHDPALERWPYADTALAVHLVRLLSLAFGALTVVAVYCTSRAVWPEYGAVALLAAGLVAFNPQFVFISSVVNNDNLLNAAAAVALWLTIRVVRGERRARTYWALGTAVGVGLLAKFSGLALLVLPTTALAAMVWRNRSLAAVWSHLSGLVLPPAMLAGWWFARNVALYGEPLGWPTHLASSGHKATASIAFGALPTDAWFLVASGWLTFGWMNVWAPLWVYLVPAGMGVASLAGWLVALRRGQVGRDALRARLPALLLLLGWGAMLFALLLVWVGLNPAGRQGRLLFAALGAYAPLGAYGLVGWLPARATWRAVTVLLLALAALAVWAYAAVLVPAYATG